MKISIEKRLAALEEMIRDMHRILVMMSQAYYWTPEWQAREKRADEDAANDRFKAFDSIEALLEELKS